MRLIYEKAQAVLIWLGEPNIRTGNALQLLLELRGLVQEFPALAEDNPSPAEVARVGRYPKLGHILEIVRDSQNLHDIESLFGRPWFCRLWVVQEVVVVKFAKLLLGETQLDLDVLLSTIYALSASVLTGMFFSPATVDVCKHLCFILELRKNAFPYALLELLNILRSLAATDPRDKLFAVLGLSICPHELMLRPNYSREVAEVFTNVAKYCLTQSDNLFNPSNTMTTDPNPLVLFSCLEVTSTDQRTLPSWVPDWTLPATTSILGKHNKLFRTDRGPISPIRFSEDNRTLFLSGHIINKIQIVERFVPYVRNEGANPWHNLYQDTENVGRYFLRCRALALQAPDPYPTGEPLEEAIWRTFVCDLNIPNESRATDELKEAWKVYQQHADKIEERLARNLVAFAQDIDAVTEEQLLLFLIHFGFARGGPDVSRSFCLTEQGRIGWIPRHSMPGDIICIFEGATVPYALRRDGQDHFKILGECYVHGLMDGEARGMKDGAFREIALT